MADQATEPVFAGMAETAGLPKKGMYTLREVSAATGVARRTLDEEVRAGRLRTFVPPRKEPRASGDARVVRRVVSEGRVK